MDNPFPQTYLNWVFGVLMTLLAGLGTLFSRRIEVLELAHRTALATYVTKLELEKYMEALATERRDMHGQNTRKLERLEDGLEAGLARIHARIDEIPYRSTNARTRTSDR